MNIQSKLPNVGTTIFTVMSALAAEHNAINLSQGFPNYSSSSRLLDLVNQYMQKGRNQYAPMAGLPALRERIAEKLDRLYSITVDPEKEITITAGATQAIFTVIATFIKPGDEVIIIDPAFDCYAPSVEVFGAKPISYELLPPDYRVNWKKLGELITPKTRMIMINTPHNPTGTILRKEDMEALERLVEGTDILVLSDEVYEHLIYDGESHQSILRFPKLRARSLATFSFGKTFHNTGWKIGYCIAPPELTKEFRKVHQFNVFCVNSPIQYALADFLTDPAEYLHLHEFYEKKRNFFLDTLKGSRLKPLVCEGTYFHLFDYSEISDLPDTAFSQKMTTDYGVAAIPVSVFYGSRRDEKIIRLCFAKTEDVLEQAGALLRKI